MAGRNRRRSGFGGVLPGPAVAPPDFPGLDILRNAWSIVMGEETIRVILRFSPIVKARVLETRWHPSQEEPIEDANGFYVQLGQSGSEVNQGPSGSLQLPIQPPTPLTAAQKKANNQALYEYGVKIMRISFIVV